MSQMSQWRCQRALRVHDRSDSGLRAIPSEVRSAELRIAPWLKRYPRHFFVAIKTGQHSAGGGTEELHQSLDCMGIDRIDLRQLHNLVDPIDWDIALSPGGVIEAATQAKQQGLIHGIGVTGHGLQIAATHRRSLDRFDFDSVLLPYNYVTMRNQYYAQNFNALVATCRERNVAVQTIKSIANKPWMGQEHTRSTWYKPLEDQADIDAAVWWVLARPGNFLNTVGDIDLLPKVLDAASRFDESTPQASLEEHLSSLSSEPRFV
jgi:aryl-alcohol dehydrogenase-like predicted oxidoreductase